MAEKNYRVDEEIKVVYQAAGAATGQVVTMEIYDETGDKDEATFPDEVMVESGASGRYISSFTPDEEGEWRVDIYDEAGGKVTKRYSVGSENVSSLGGKFGAVAKTGEDGDTLETLSDQMDALESPPMVS